MPRPLRPRPIPARRPHPGPSAALPLLALLVLPAPAADSPRPGPPDVGAVADPSLVLPGRVEVASPHTAPALAARRARLAAELGEGLFLVAAGRDGQGRFEAHSDFLYLAGVEVPGAILVLGAADGALELERLYLPEPSPRRALWDGALLGPGEEAQRRTGVAVTRGLGELERDLDELLGTGPGEGRSSEATTPTRTVYALTDQRPDLFGRPPEGREVRTASPREALNALQKVKDEAELAALRAAVDVTLAAMADGFAVARPGAFEFQVEAAIEAGFRRRGAPFRAFPSICGSGPNACVLHYRDNERLMLEGELLLLDVGAKVHGYSADVSRTIPLEDRFDPRQRELYELVVRAHDRAAAVLRPGATIRAAQQAAREVFEERDLARYFLHSVGHHLGLRVHDVPGFRGPLEEGMVVTIEPGLYLAEEAIGIRIENDFLITADGAELLSGAIPYHTDELEAYLARIRGARER